MDSIDSHSSEESILVEDDEQEAVPSIYSNKSNDRLFHEGRRRRILVVLLAASAAVALLCSWRAAGGLGVQTTANGTGTSKLSEVHEKSSAESQRSRGTNQVAAAIEESAVVSLAESAPPQAGPLLASADGAGAPQQQVATRASTPGTVKGETKQLRGAQASAGRAGRRDAAAEEAKGGPGTQTLGVVPEKSRPASPVNGKAQSLQMSDMPGAAADAVDGKAMSLERSDFPGAAVDGETKESALKESDFPGAARTQDTKAAALQKSDFPRTGEEDSKAAALERSDFPGASEDGDSKATALERSDFPGASDNVAPAKPTRATAAPPSVPSSVAPTQKSTVSELASPSKWSSPLASATGTSGMEVLDEARAVGNILEAATV